MIAVADKVSLSNSPLSGVPSSREKELPRQRFGAFSAGTGDAARAKGVPLFTEDRVTISREAVEIQALASRDREVRSHEAAHASVGGAYAGSPSYTYQSGPDGQRYAVEGEVSIDTSPVAGDPQGTLKKAEQVRAAAMAPEQPRRIAAKASLLAVKARGEILAERARTTEEKSLASLPLAFSSIEMAHSSGTKETGSLIKIYG